MKKLEQFVFKDARKSALDYWLEHTGRSIRDNSLETYQDAYECNWQEKLCNFQEDYHCPLVCWIGSWGTNISEVLLDQSLDSITYIEDHQYEDDPTIEKMVRYAHRLMIVGEELLQGLGELANVFGKRDELRNAEGKSIDVFHSYVNNIIKHRENSCCYLGHHPKLLIDWSQNASITQSYPKIPKKKLSDCLACVGGYSSPLCPPSPLSIVQTFLVGYEFCNSMLEDSNSDLAKLCRRYGE